MKQMLRPFKPGEDRFEGVEVRLGVKKGAQGRATVLLLAQASKEKDIRAGPSLASGAEGDVASLHTR